MEAPGTYAANMHRGITTMDNIPHEVPKCKREIKKISKNFFGLRGRHFPAFPRWPDLLVAAAKFCPKKQVPAKNYSKFLLPVV